ncbi:MAG: hypothetical protein ABIJ34_01185 [archaeon]
MGLCIICEKNPAQFCVKGVEKYCYCKDCAEEQFGELGLLERI